ncbi:MAG: hypothetical protein U0X40_04835 [Ferruginibacter sp.]
MKRILNTGLLLSSFPGYLEWGRGQHSFLIEAEIQIFQKAVNDAVSVLHPFTVIPLIGQILLIISLFRKNPNRLLTFAGMACIAGIMLLLLLIGIMSGNWKIIASVLPFLVLSFFVIRFNRKKAATG